MRIIFVDVPISLKYFVYIISKIFKEKYFFNMKNIASSEFLFKKKIKPINFEDNNYSSIEKYIFGINSGLENFLKSFFFLDLEKTLKNYFRDTYNKKAIYSSLQQFIIPLSDYTGKLKIWIESKKPKKNLVIYFHSKFYFSPSISKNTYTIIIPLNLFFFISFKKLSLKKKILKN